MAGSAPLFFLLKIMLSSRSIRDRRSSLCGGVLGRALKTTHILSKDPMRPICIFHTLTGFVM